MRLFGNHLRGMQINKKNQYIDESETRERGSSPNGFLLLQNGNDPP